MPKRWTTGERRSLERLHEAGKSDAAVDSSISERTLAAVKAKRRRLRLPEPQDARQQKLGIE